MKSTQNQSDNRFWVGRIAVFTAAVLLFNVLAAPWAEANFWKERRGSVPAHSNPSKLFAAPSDKPWPRLAATAAPIVSDFSQTLPVVSRNFETHITLPPHPAGQNFPSWLASLPSAYGDVQKVWSAPGANGKSWVVLVQDAHAVVSAQRNIAHILDHLQNNNPDSNLFVGLEGASGPFRLSSLRGFPDADIHASVGNYLLENSFLSGPEYFAINAQREPVLWGVESAELYLANVEAYRSGLTLKTNLQKHFNDYEDQLVELRKKILSPDLRTLDQSLAGYGRGDTDLLSHVRVLLSWAGSAVQNFSAVQELSNVLKQEASLDFQAVEAERARLLAALVPDLKNDEVQTLMQMSLAYKAGRVGYSDYYGFFRKLADSHHLSLKDYPHFQSYIAYVSATEKIDRYALFHEVDKLSAYVLENCPATKAQRDLLRLDSDLSLARRIMDRELGSEEWKKYLGRRDDIHAAPQRLAALKGNRLNEEVSSFAADLNYMEDFYRVADQRNQAMMDGFLQKIKSNAKGSVALVTGGFHTPELARLLEEKKISYVVVTPKVGEVSGRNSQYLDVFAVNHTPLEKMMLGERLDLSPYRNLAEVPVSFAAGESQRRMINFAQADAIYWGLRAALSAAGGRVDRFAEWAQDMLASIKNMIPQLFGAYPGDFAFESAYSPQRLLIRKSDKHGIQYFRIDEKSSGQDLRSGSSRGSVSHEIEIRQEVPAKARFQNLMKGIVPQIARKLHRGVTYIFWQTAGRLWDWVIERNDHLERLFGFLSRQDQMPLKLDLILVFGNYDLKVLKAAAELWYRQYKIGLPVNIVVSGGVGRMTDDLLNSVRAEYGDAMEKELAQDGVTSPTESDMMSWVLRRVHNIPTDFIIPEPEATTSQGNAVKTLELPQVREMVESNESLNVAVFQFWSDLERADTTLHRELIRRGWQDRVHIFRGTSGTPSVSLNDKDFLKNLEMAVNAFARLRPYARRDDTFPSPIHPGLVRSYEIARTLFLTLASNKLKWDFVPSFGSLLKGMNVGVEPKEGYLVLTNYDRRKDFTKADGNKIKIEPRLFIRLMDEALPASANFRQGIDSVLDVHPDMIQNKAVDLSQDPDVSEWAGISDGSSAQVIRKRPLLYLGPLLLLEVFVFRGAIAWLVPVGSLVLALPFPLLAGIVLWSTMGFSFSHKLINWLARTYYRRRGVPEADLPQLISWKNTIFHLLPSSIFYLGLFLLGFQVLHLTPFLALLWAYVPQMAADWSIARRPLPTVSMIGRGVIALAGQVLVNLIFPPLPMNMAAVVAPYTQGEIINRPMDAENFRPLVSHTVPEMEGKVVAEVTMEMTLTGEMVALLRNYLENKNDPRDAALRQFVDQELRECVMANSAGGIGPLLKERIIAMAAQGANPIGFSLLYDNVWVQMKVPNADDPSINHMELVKVPVGHMLRSVLEEVGTVPVTMFDGGIVHARVWRTPAETYGHASVYFLDAPEISGVMYPGPKDAPAGADAGSWGEDNRYRQSWLLGRGSLKVMRDLLHIKPDHIVMSETSAVFAHPNLVQDELQWDPFFAKTRTTFNDHTPLEYAHPVWSQDIVRRLRIDERFYRNLPVWSTSGREGVDVTAMIINCSNGVYGVARKHARVMQEMGILLQFAEKIKYVTNGVSSKYWPMGKLKELLESYMAQWENAPRPGHEQITGDLKALVDNDPQAFDEALEEKRKAKSDLIELLGHHVELLPGDDVEKWKADLRKNNNPIAFWMRRLTNYKRLDVFISMLENDFFRNAFIKMGIVIAIGGRTHQDDPYGPIQYARLQQLYARAPELRRQVIYFANYNAIDAATLIRGADAGVMLAEDRREAAGTSHDKIGMDLGLMIADEDGSIGESVVFYDGQNEQDANGFNVPYENTLDWEGKKPVVGPTPTGVFNALTKFHEVYWDEARLKLMRRNAFARSWFSSVERTAEDELKFLAEVNKDMKERAARQRAGHRRASGILPSREFLAKLMARKANFVFRHNGGGNFNEVYNTDQGLRGMAEGLRRLITSGTIGEKSLSQDEAIALTDYLLELIGPDEDFAKIRNYLTAWQKRVVNRKQDLAFDRKLLLLHYELMGFLDGIVRGSDEAARGSVFNKIFVSPEMARKILTGGTNFIWRYNYGQTQALYGKVGLRSFVDEYYKQVSHMNERDAILWTHNHDLGIFKHIVSLLKCGRTDNNQLNPLVKIIQELSAQADQLSEDKMDDRTPFTLQALSWANEAVPYLEKVAAISTGDQTTRYNLLTGRSETDTFGAENGFSIITTGMEEQIISELRELGFSDELLWEVSLVFDALRKAGIFGPMLTTPNSIYVYQALANFLEDLLGLVGKNSQQGSSPLDESLLSHEYDAHLWLLDPKNTKAKSVLLTKIRKWLKSHPNEYQQIKHEFHRLIDPAITPAKQKNRVAVEFSAQVLSYYFGLQNPQYAAYPSLHGNKFKNIMDDFLREVQPGESLSWGDIVKSFALHPESWNPSDFTTSGRKDAKWAIFFEFHMANLLFRLRKDQDLLLSEANSAMESPAIESPKQKVDRLRTDRNVTRAILVKYLNDKKIEAKNIHDGIWGYILENHPNWELDKDDLSLPAEIRGELHDMLGDASHYKSIVEDIDKALHELRKLPAENSNDRLEINVAREVLSGFFKTRTVQHEPKAIQEVRKEVKLFLEQWISLSVRANRANDEASGKMFQPRLFDTPFKYFSFVGLGGLAVKFGLDQSMSQTVTAGSWVSSLLIVAGLILSVFVIDRIVQWFQSRAAARRLVVTRQLFGINGAEFAGEWGKANQNIFEPREGVSIWQQIVDKWQLPTMSEPSDRIEWADQVTAALAQLSNTTEGKTFVSQLALPDLVATLLPLPDQLWLRPWTMLGRWLLARRILIRMVSIQRDGRTPVELDANAGGIVDATREALNSTLAARLSPHQLWIAITDSLAPSWNDRAGYRMSVSLTALESYAARTHETAVRRENGRVVWISVDLLIRYLETELKVPGDQIQTLRQIVLKPESPAYEVSAQLEHRLKFKFELLEWIFGALFPWKPGEFQERLKFQDDVRRLIALFA